MDRADVPAVNASGAVPAERTRRRPPLRQDVEDQPVIGKDTVCDAERGEMGKEVGRVHGRTPEVGSPLLPRLAASSGTIPLANSGSGRGENRSGRTMGDWPYIAVVFRHPKEPPHVPPSPRCSLDS